MLQQWGEECCCVRQRAWWCHGLTLIAWYQDIVACGAKKLQLPQWLCDPTEVTQRGQCKTCRWLYRWVHLNVILVITLTHYNFCFYKPTNRNAAWKTKYHRWRVNVTEKLKTWYGSLSTISRHGTTSTMLCQYSRKQETVYRACRPPAHHFCTGLTFLTWKLCVWCWFTETMSVLVNTYPTKDQTQA